MRYAQIRKMDISNGNSTGISLFTQGCRFHCKNCFNQSTWDFNGGFEWNDSVKEEFLSLADHDYIKRISILGGEPLADENIHDIADLVLSIKERYPNKTIWVYTGYAFEDLMFTSISMQRTKDIITIFNNIDVLVDGRFVDELKDLKLKFRGSSNQRIIDIKKTLFKRKVVLYME